MTYEKTINLGPGFNLDTLWAEERARQQQAATKKKAKKQKGFLLDQLSTGGGIGGALAGAAGGAAVGSVVPILGTAAGGIIGALLGGAAGSAAGELGENAITGDRLDKNVANEALIGGATSLPIGAGFKLARAGLKAGTGIGKTSARELVEQAGAKVVPGKLAGSTMQLGDTGKPALKSSLTGRLKQSGDKALTSQYGTLSKPVIRSTNPAQTVRELADIGITKPQDAERIAQGITGPDGILTQQVAKSVQGAAPVKVDTLRSVFNDALDNYGIVDKDRKSLNTLFEAQMTKLRGANPQLNGVNPTDALSTMKSLEKRVANLRGKGDNYRMSTPEREDQANVLQLVRDELESQLYEGAGGNKSLQKVLTPEVRQKLIGLYPGNQKWADYVDNTVMKSKDIGSVRSAQAPFVRASKMIEEGDNNAFSFGGRMNASAGGIRDALLQGAQKVTSGPVARGYSAATRAIPGEGIVKATERSTQSIPMLTARQVGGRLLTADAPQPDQSSTGIDQLPMDGTQALDAQAQMEEPSIGGVTKSQLEQAMFMAAADGNTDAISQLKAMYDLLPESSSLNSTASARVESTANAENTLNQLQGLFNAAGGGGGRIGGNIQNLLAGAGLNDTGQAYNDLSKSSVSQLARAINGGGQVSDADAAVLVQALPRLTDSREVAAQKIAALKQRLAVSRQNTLLYGAGAADPSATSQGY